MEAAALYKLLYSRRKVNRTFSHVAVSFICRVIHSPISGPTDSPLAEVLKGLLEEQTERLAVLQEVKRSEAAKDAREKETKKRARVDWCRVLD